MLFNTADLCSFPSSDLVWSSRRPRPSRYDREFLLQPLPAAEADLSYHQFWNYKKTPEWGYWLTMIPGG